MLDPYERLAKEGSLAAALNAVLAEMNERYDPEARAVYDRFIDWLRQGAVGRGALAVGDQLPPFVLPDHEGRLTSSDELLAQGPLVLSFFRGGWCPYCGLEMAALEQARAAIEAAGAAVVGVTPETFDFPHETAVARRLGYRLLSDADNGLALSLGLVFRMPQEVIDTYLRRGADLAPRQGNEAWMFPVPGTFVIDAGGVVRLAFVEVDYRIRLAPEALIEAVRRL